MGVCGRYGLATPARLVELTLPPSALDPDLLAEVLETPPRWNITPSQRIWAIAADPNGRRATRLRWGLIPFWAKDPAIGQRLANARGETVRTKPSFRNAFASRRAVVFADLYYEWQALDGTRRKQPWCIRRPDEGPFALAALWERWTPPDAASDDPSPDAATETGHGTTIETCTLITTQSTERLAAIHHRMPVILNPADIDRWLDLATPGDAVEELLAPPTVSDMRAYRVSTHVNSPANDDAACIAPLADTRDDEDEDAGRPIR